MDVDIGWVFLNLAYAVYVVSPIFTRMLPMRIVMMMATALFITYGLVSGVMSVVWWNIPFGAMHAWQIWRLLSERWAVDLDEEERSIHKRLFPTLDEVDFHALWSMGTEELVDGATRMITCDERTDRLLLVIDGEVEVVTRASEKVRLGAMEVVGEMSLVSGDVANATVHSCDPIRVRSWAHKDLIALGEKNAKVKEAGLLLIGQQLARKVAGRAREASVVSAGDAPGTD
jgi:hypothetical protein